MELVITSNSLDKVWKEVLVTDNVYVIRAWNRSQAGRYQCMAWNGIMRNETLNCSIDVHCKLIDYLEFNSRISFCTHTWMNVKLLQVYIQTLIFYLILRCKLIDYLEFTAVFFAHILSWMLKFCQLTKTHFLFDFAIQKILQHQPWLQLFRQILQCYVTVLCHWAVMQMPTPVSILITLL